MIENDEKLNKMDILRLLEKNPITVLYYNSDSKPFKLRNEIFDFDEINCRYIKNIAIKMAEKSRM
jgi:hypothetical protein